MGICSVFILCCMIEKLQGHLSPYRLILHESSCHVYNTHHDVHNGLAYTYDYIYIYINTVDTVKCK